MPCQVRRFLSYKEEITRRQFENETENRKKAAELFAHAGDGRRADAGDGADGVCGGAKSDLHSWRNK